MDGRVLVALLEPVVLLDVVKVILSEARERETKVSKLGQRGEAAAAAACVASITDAGVSRTLRMMTVFFILVVLMMPVIILPRMLTFPVHGHFLSTYVPSMAVLGVLTPRPTGL